jgi:hypothetical protein
LPRGSKVCGVARRQFSKGFVNIAVAIPAESMRDSAERLKRQALRGQQLEWTRIGGELIEQAMHPLELGVIAGASGDALTLVPQRCQPTEVRPIHRIHGFPAIEFCAIELYTSLRQGTIIDATIM